MTKIPVERYENVNEAMPHFNSFSKVTFYDDGSIRYFIPQMKPYPHVKGYKRRWFRCKGDLLVACDASRNLELGMGIALYFVSKIYPVVSFVEYLNEEVVT